MKQPSMHPRTVATLNELEKAEWFSRVGVKDTMAAIVLSSWQEAIKHCSSLEWENLVIEASNQYCERLVERSKERWRQWNKIVVELKKITEPFVRQKIEVVARKNNLPQVFENLVQWDILGVCLEAEYADVPVRSLPAWKTAYPRTSKLFEDPGQGLATIEAIYAAYKILGREAESLLSEYRWAEEFRELNCSLIQETSF